MNILSSALPGIREVRAPLVAGYLWLLLLWLICDPGRDFANVHGTAAQVVDLCHTAGPIATAVGVSVAAYLIGALSHPPASLLGTVARKVLGALGAWLTVRLTRPVPAPERRTRSSPGSRSEEWEREAVQDVVTYPFASADIAHELRPRLVTKSISGMPLSSALQEISRLIVEGQSPQDLSELRAAQHQLQDFERRLIRQTWRTCALSTEPIENDITRAERLYEAMPDSRRPAIWGYLLSTTRDLADEAEEQLAIPATLLVGDQPLPFAQADRDRAEAELRIDVALPLAALSVYLAMTASVAWVGGLIAVVALLWQGLMSEDASKRLIVETLHHKRIPITAFEKFSRAVKEAEEAAVR
jgi:hypothetical protein